MLKPIATEKSLDRGLKIIIPERITGDGQGPEIPGQINYNPLCTLK